MRTGGLGFFDDIPTLSEMSEVEAALKVYEMTVPENESGSSLKTEQPFSIFIEPKPYRFANHVFGHIRAGSSEPSLPIEQAGIIEPDLSLRGGSLTVRLDRLWIEEYPGGGTHQILFDFYAENHIGVNKVERIHFNLDPAIERFTPQVSTADCSH